LKTEIVLVTLFW